MNASATNPMGTPHTPTMKWTIAVVIVIVIVYHFVAGKGRK